jgi:excinuclease UvrABC nuclease subunit
VTVDPAPELRAAASWEGLTNAGFRLLGDWTSDPASVLRLEAKAPRSPCVYAFVVDDLVVYVGLSKSGLHTRFEQYRQGHKRERTDSCINDPIASTLAAAKRVKVLVATPEPSEWNGLPVNTAAGLEAGLIERIGPIWNILEGAMKARDGLGPLRGAG